jgi:hypothetical protein
MAMERGFWITLSNSAGILDSAFARTEEEARELAIELLSGFPHRDDSDMPRLRVEAGAVCRPAGRVSSAEVIRNFSLHSENIKEEAAAMPGLSIRRSGDQLHNSLAGGNSGQTGMDDVLLPAPPLDADAAPDPAVDP